jgi:hypothetical protein
MTGLENWLQQATRRLSNESAAQVRAEIQEHFESAREAAILAGATTHDADRSALAALGDPNTANCQYRRVLLTSEEARLLRTGNWEARAICSRPWLKLVLPAIPAAATLAATGLFLAGALPTARVALVLALATCLFGAAPFLPIYTPSRSRVFRWVKWTLLIGIFALTFGPDILKMSWLMIPSLWPVFWIEWRRISIRRKLPVSRWPRQLYL